MDMTHILRNRLCTMHSGASISTTVPIGKLIATSRSKRGHPSLALEIPSFPNQLVPNEVRAGHRSKQAKLTTQPTFHPIAQVHWNRMNDRWEKTGQIVPPVTPADPI